MSAYNVEGHKKRWMTIALHVLIWLMVFLIPYIFSADVERGAHRADNDENEFLYLNTALNFFWVALFYFNAGLLIPRLIYKRKIALYVLALLGLLVLVILLDDLLFQLLSIPRTFSVYHSVEHNFIPFVFTVAVSAAYKAITDKTKSDIQAQEKRSENLKTELSFLRSQISPHFLFNVMNNIAALVRLKSDELEPTIHKLSSLMQYMLYETDEEKVVVKSEVEYLQAYIDLQRQRHGDELILQALFTVKEEWQTIEPMLLIPFVENAFKHGGSLQQPSIHVSMAVIDSELHFIVKNKFEERGDLKDKTSGIGLANVKRRLELLYPGKHVLKIDKQSDWFTIDLVIILK
jgi:two-component system, LytTR family, sensor kinase